jgi:hypothetical protein
LPGIINGLGSILKDFFVKTIDKKDCDLCEHHSHSVWEEFVCHVPYAGFSLALGFAFLSIIYFIGLGFAHPDLATRGYHVMFHSFHYLHVIVAVAGCAITFFRFSRNVLLGVVVSLVAPTFFCILSDIMLPTLAGRILGVPMDMHICFFCPHDAMNLFAFMIVGLLCGVALLQHKESLKTFSLTSHFLHILVSSMASIFYIVANGFDTWYESMGILFVFLFIAVIIPCTLSDVVVPLYFARGSRRK